MKKWNFYGLIYGKRRAAVTSKEVAVIFCKILFDGLEKCRLKALRKAEGLVSLLCRSEA